MAKRIQKKAPCAAGMLLALAVTFTLGMLAGGMLDPQVQALQPFLHNTPSADSPDFHLMKEAWKVIRRSYVDRSAIKPQPLTYGALGGMVDALGDTGHSRFLSPEMLKAQNDFARGRYKGIGAQVQTKNNQVVVVTPIDGSPAQQAGLRPGDIIMKVNGQDITSLTLDEVVSRIVGPEGTSVTLTILTPGTGTSQDVTLTRASITVHNVTWHRLPGERTAHVRIAGFSQGVAEELKKALTQIKEQNLSGIILDLRNNPGGLLDEAIGCASQFLTKGNVLLERNAQGEVRPIPVKAGAVAPDVPMVVLINGGSASASEIVAGALQAAQRSRLLGETTFGTGTVLKDFVLSDGSALLLAVEEWLTPSGSVIWHKGITPDVVVPMPQQATPLIPETERGLSPEQLKSSGDVQLLRALDLLKSSEGLPIAS